MGVGHTGSGHTGSGHTGSGQALSPDGAPWYRLPGVTLTPQWTLQGAQSQPGQWQSEHLVHWQFKVGGSGGLGHSSLMSGHLGGGGKVGQVTFIRSGGSKWIVLAVTFGCKTMEGGLGHLDPAWWAGAAVATTPMRLIRAEVICRSVVLFLLKKANVYEIEKLAINVSNFLMILTNLWFFSTSPGFRLHHLAQLLVLLHHHQVLPLPLHHQVLSLLHYH